MNGLNPCCRNLPESPRSPSPFDRVVALGYYDGPTSGLLRCGSCGREFLFQWIEVDEEPAGNDEVRIFGLSSLPSGSIASFDEAMKPYDPPRVPLWFPVWSFPTEEARAKMEEFVDRLYAIESAEGLAVACKDGPMGEIIACRRVPPAELKERRDWFAFLGLIKAEAGA